MLKLFILALSFMAFSYPNSDHYDGKKFFLPWGDDLKSFWSLLKWKMTSSPAKWPDHIPNKKIPLKFLTPSEKINTVFINHATFLLQFPGLNILTDPIYSKRSSPLQSLGPIRVREPGIPLDLLPRIDVVLVSHNHYDHLDLETLKKLDKKFHPLFLVPLGDEKLLKEEGIGKIQAMDWWEEKKVGDVRMIFAPAQHWSARHLWDKNHSLWGSWMVDSGKVRVYHAGDSGYGPHFLEIKRRLGAPDLALLPIGAYAPRWFMGYYHMNPEDAVKAHQDLAARKSIGMHFGTFQLTDEGFDEPVHDLKIARDKYFLTPEEFITLEEGHGLSW